MRDPSRIPSVLAAIHNIWKRQPDLRLSQLIIIAAAKSGRSVECPALFSLEDDELLRGLRNYSSEPTPSGDIRSEHPNDKFWAGEVIEGAAFHPNQHVRFVQGDHVGEDGFVISLEGLLPEPSFRVERARDGRDVVLPQSWLEAVE